jgi:CxxC motif-containing protein (DUF1111 family)
MALSVAAAGEAPIGTQPFTDHRNPPPYRRLSEAELARYDLGMAVFNTQFVVAGTANAGRRDGVGPLFNSASCDACHNNGAHGRGPTEDGPAPAPLVVQLATPGSPNLNDPDGDPVYGRVFNTLALDGVPPSGGVPPAGGVPPEGRVTIHYEEAIGHYPDGTAWHLRVPHYTFTVLGYGPLAPRTIIKPRLAPALFGAGLLDTVSPDALLPAGASAPAATQTLAAPLYHGRFGWQAAALSVRDQTARAFSREMGLTSTDRPHDDCTSAETACLQQPNGGSPEVSDDLFDAVVSFQRWLAVPASPSPHATPDVDGRMFAELGCAACHQPSLPVSPSDSEGKSFAGTIAPYTDLRLHDLGTRLADSDAAGHKVASKWRTAPLWGLGYRVSFERFPTFLHDGRAR